MVSSHYFYFKIVIYLHIVKELELQVTIFDTNNLQLYGIKYSYQIQIIFKQIYLTYRCIVVGLGVIENKKVLPRSSNLEPHY